MPASQKLDVFNGLEITVEPVEEPDPVFFTHEKPEFEITFRNNDSKYEWTEDSAVTWAIETDTARVTHSDTVEFGPLDYGEERTVTVGGKVLAYEGHGVFGISSGSASGNKKSDRWTLKSRKGRSADPAYSFSVWDKSHYDASIRKPKRLQVGLIITSVVLIVFAFVQILLALLV